MHLQSSLMMMIGCCHSLQQANPLLISKYFGRCESAGSLLTTADADVMAQIRWLRFMKRWIQI